MTITDALKNQTHDAIVFMKLLILIPVVVAVFLIFGVFEPPLVCSGECFW